MKQGGQEVLLIRTHQDHNIFYVDLPLVGLISIRDKFNIQMYIKSSIADFPKFMLKLIYIPSLIACFYYATTDIPIRRLIILILFCTDRLAARVRCSTITQYRLPYEYNIFCIFKAKEGMTDNKSGAKLTHSCILKFKISNVGINTLLEIVNADCSPIRSMTQTTFGGR